MHAANPHKGIQIAPTQGQRFDFQGCNTRDTHRFDGVERAFFKRQGTLNIKEVEQFNPGEANPDPQHLTITGGEIQGQVRSGAGRHFERRGAIINHLRGRVDTHGGAADLIDLHRNIAGRKRKQRNPDKRGRTDRSIHREPRALVALIRRREGCQRKSYARQGQTDIARARFQTGKPAQIFPAKGQHRHCNQRTIRQRHAQGFLLNPKAAF